MLPKTLILSGAALWFGLSGSAFGQNAAATVSVDAAANRHAINPGIYGTNYGDAADVARLNAPLNRWGGNATTRYNWQIDAHSAGADWYFETYADSNGTPGGSADRFVTATRSPGNGAEPMITIPMIDYLAGLGPNRSTLEGFSVKKYGPQKATDPYNADAGNGVSLATGTAITGNDPLDTGVANSPAIQQAWVQHLVATFGPATSPTGVKYYLLDNEPSIWSGTHRDVHPNPPTYDEIWTKIKAYASAIRAADPAAKIAGPEEWSWFAMYYSGFDQANGAAAANSDFNTHDHTYYYPWLLQQLAAYQQQTGIRLVDVLTTHGYNATPGNNDDSAAAQLVRNRETRILWDPTFQDPSWYGDIDANHNGRILNWIPTLKAMVAQYCPGLAIGFTEYNWGDEANLNGATTQADVLGIYGREGLDLATRWTVAKDTSTTPATLFVTDLASRIYRNYDGFNSTFGDTSVGATVANPDELSAFAALRRSDGALTVMVINKQVGSTPVSISLAHFPNAGPAQAWQINSAAQTAVARLADVPVNNASVACTVPSQSITLFIIPAADSGLVPPAPVGVAADVADGAVTLTWNASLGATSYTVARAGASGGPYAPLGSVSTPGFTDTGLTNGTAYYYVITAANSIGTGPASAEITATPILPPTFTSSATASPNPVAGSTSANVTATVTDAANVLTNGTVVISVIDPTGTVAASQTYPGQNLAAGQTESYPLAFIPTTAGIYSVTIGVFSASHQAWHRNDAAGTVTVTGPPTFSSTATATPSTLPPGSSSGLALTVSDTAGVGLADANVELQVFNHTGSAVMTTVWSGQNFTGGQTQSYSYTWTVPSDLANGSYSVAIGVFDASWATNFHWNGSAETVTVDNIPVGPAIVNQPESQTAAARTAVTFSITVTGNPTPTYQWAKDNAPIPGATGAVLTVANLGTDDAGSYSVTVTNPSGSVTSTPATLTVNRLPQVITFAQVHNQPFTIAPLVVVASASSALPATLTVVAGPATLAGNLLTPTGVGPVTLEASQAGNPQFLPAESVTQTFAITADFASWQLSGFTPAELADPAVSGANAIPRADRLPNLVKYALGLDPRQTATAGLPVVINGGPSWNFTYQRPSGIADVTYTAEISTDLLHWTDYDVTQRLASSTGGVETWVASCPATAGQVVFFHLKLTLITAPP